MVTGESRIDTLELPQCALNARTTGRKAGRTLSAGASEQTGQRFVCWVTVPGACAPQSQCQKLFRYHCYDNRIGDAIRDRRVMPGRRDLQQFWCSVQRWLTSISAAIRSEQPGQRLCRSSGAAVPSVGSSQSISLAIASELSGTGEGGFELADVVRVKPLAFCCRHLALLALCHLFSRQAAKKGDLVYTYKVVGSLHFRFELKKSDSMISPRSEPV